MTFADKHLSIMTWIVVIIPVGFGIYYLFWPGHAQQQFMSRFDLDSPVKWYKPNTFLRFSPPVIVFRILGAVLILFGLLLYSLPAH